MCFLNVPGKKPEPKELTHNEWKERNNIYDYIFKEMCVLKIIIFGRYVETPQFKF